MLKKKEELKNRKGLTWKDCSTCLNFVERFEGCGTGMLPSKMGRCREIGLSPGKQYRILPKYICDAHKANPKYHQGGV
ncbi:MAG: hypothetical protein VR65_24935 [Desulfobulbaceae bacterium BRH_c16a]|nr:MAG: hypothetical protein VR65_24935 [Desulfobulbaceae bacterium BRH_c16a]